MAARVFAFEARRTAVLVAKAFRILTFAPADKISVMREMLLEHGAKETAEDKRYWKLRQVNDAYETKRVQAFYEDDRHLSPIGCAMGL